MIDFKSYTSFEILEFKMKSLKDDTGELIGQLSIGI